MPRPALKIIIAGDKGIGKRTLLSTLGAPRRLSSFYIPIEFVTLDLTSQHGNVTVHAYDSIINRATIQDKESRNDISSLNLEAADGAHAAILVYSRDNRRSFDDLRDWAKEIPVGIPVFLVGLYHESADARDRITDKDIEYFSQANRIEQHFVVPNVSQAAVDNIFQTILAKDSPKKAYTDNTNRSGFYQSAVNSRNEIISPNHVQPQESNRLNEVRPAQVDMAQSQQVTLQAHANTSSPTKNLESASYVKKFTVVPDFGGESRHMKISKKETSAAQQEEEEPVPEDF